MRMHFTQNSSGDDSLDCDDIDQIFSRLDQLHLPADFVNRVSLEVSHLPLPQLIQLDATFSWDDEGLMVHHEYKRPS